MSAKTCPRSVGDRFGRRPVPSASGTGRGQEWQKMVNQQVNGPFTCPQSHRGQVGTGAAEHLSPVPPSLIGGQGQGQRGTARRSAPQWRRELGRERARTLKAMDCPNCGRPVEVGPDDEIGGYGEIVGVDPHRLTRLGMYQAATSGRRLFVVTLGKYGPKLDWLGDWATPDPDITHLVAAHHCDLPPADHRPPEPQRGSTITDTPPF